MRSWGAALAAGALVAALTGCSGDEPELVPQYAETPTVAPSYDPAETDSNAAVLPLVPDAAVDLTVTDFDQIRLQLGKPDLTGDDPRPEREAFWREAQVKAPLLLGGMLLDVDAQLEREFGWTQDDVAWEAHFGGPEGVGWVLKIRDDLPMGDITRAVDAGVGPLAGAEVQAEDHLVLMNAATDGADSWAADPQLLDLVGSPGSATYLTRECLAFDDVYGEGMRESLAPSPSADVGLLEELDAFSVTFGGELATVRLGTERADVFERMRLPENLPQTDPEFGLGYQRGAADPFTGRIGYRLGDPVVAGRLALEKQLPFAVCAD